MMGLEQCYCGRDLPESTGMLHDGQPLGCGCDGGWSVDGESDPYPDHSDECRKCLVEDLAQAESDIRDKDARIAVLEDTIRWALGQLDHGPPEKPDHHCYLGSTDCDMGCMDWARFHERMSKARRLAPSQKEGGREQHRPQSTTIPICDGAARSRRDGSDGRSLLSSTPRS